jgi:hypothetical protein
MAQLFKPSANNVAKLSLIVGAILPIGILYAGSTASRSPANTKVNLPLDQPIPFSHKHHVFELGIDCRYCHTSVETSAVAGVPPTETCMSCHSQIWTNSPLLQPLRDSYAQNKPIEWRKVAKVPEFVFFNHSIHVQRGINCNQCHGPVQEMNITWKGKAFWMSWCLECHKNPEKYVYADSATHGLSPKDQVFELYRKYSRGDTLSPREYSLIKGHDYVPSKAELAESKKLVQERQINPDQIQDCSICHH